MLYILIGLGLLFIGIGYLVKENNAKYVLSGYNSLSAEEQKKVDIKLYIAYFKKFHFFLGVSLLILGLLLLYIFDTNVAGIFMGIYPILGYIYFIWTSQEYYADIRGTKSKTTLGVIVLVITVLFVSGIFLKGNQEDLVFIEKDKLIIEGFYGEEIPISEIENIVLVDTLPHITSRKNGYSSGDVRKGYFQTGFRKRVKLILNSNEKPYLFIRTKGNRNIYYSLREEKNKELFEKINKEIKTYNPLHVDF